MVLWDSQWFGMSSGLGCVAVQDAWQLRMLSTSECLVVWDAQLFRTHIGSGCVEVWDAWWFGMLSSSGHKHDEQQFGMCGGFGCSMVQDVQWFQGCMMMCSGSGCPVVCDLGFSMEM